MKEKKLLQDGREVIYEESFWLGTKKITIDGIQLEKVSRNMVQYNGNTWKVKGNYFTGVNMEYNGAKIELLSKLPWYEYVMAVIPFIFNIIFIGGIIGAFIAVLSLVFSVIIFRSFKNMLFKLFAFLGICAISYLIFEILVILEIIALG